MRTGCFPGSFDPPTVAHLAVADAARRHHALDRVDLVVSRRPLGKSVPVRPTLEERVAVLEAVAERVAWLGVVVSDARLVADLSEGYDVVVMGADKWVQVHDVAFYGGSAERRDEAVRRLPLVAVAPRADVVAPAGGVVLPVDGDLAAVSSTLARAGRVELMLPEARAYDELTGVWTG